MRSRRCRGDFFVDSGRTRYAPYIVGSVSRSSDHSLAGGGLAASWLDRNSRIGSNGRQSGPMKELDLPKRHEKSSSPSSRPYVNGPTDAHVPRPRHPYDAPRRKRSTRSPPHKNIPQRVPSYKAPVPPLPPLPLSFNPLMLGENSETALRTNRRQKTHRPRPERQGEGEGLVSDLPPPTRRPPRDPQTSKQEEPGQLRTSYYLW